MYKSDPQVEYIRGCLQPKSGDFEILGVKRIQIQGSDTQTSMCKSVNWKEVVLLSSSELGLKLAMDGESFHVRRPTGVLLLKWNLDDTGEGESTASLCFSRNLTCTVAAREEVYYFINDVSQKAVCTVRSGYHCGDL